MRVASFARLARYYQQRIARLFGSANLFDFIDNPALADTPEFRSEAWKVVRGMVHEVAQANALSWRQAAMKSTRAREIIAGLQQELKRGGVLPELEAIARRNAALIRSVPADVAQRITQRAGVLQRNGARPEEIAREIRALGPQLVRSRVQLIARTEISRAETDLTRARSERIGIGWYQWQTSEDARVRPSHRNMDGVLVAWDDPPAPEALIHEHSTLGHYHAGQAPQCRCPALPLADLDEVRWPAKVYRFGKIQRMTRAQFTRSTEIRIAA